MAARDWTRRAALLAGGAAAGAGAAAWALRPDGAVPARAGLWPADAPGTLDDASLLSATPVARHVTLGQDPGEALLAALRSQLRQARAEGRPLCLSAARHSMGGHALPRDGVALTAPGGVIEADAAARTMRVAAGARWAEVIAALDPLGLSPKVMQSNNDFGVGATLSVNAHGWPTAHPPMGATVRHATVLLADGSVVTCSREENAQVLAGVTGGYGLLGLVTEMEVEVERNVLLAPSCEAMPAEDFGAAFAGAAAASPMAYGRMRVDREGFWEEALLCRYGPAPGKVPPATGSGTLSRLSRPVFRAQVGNEWWKRRRWWIESALAPRLAGAATRNTLLNEPVATLDDRDAGRTDILHEYFVPPAAWRDFLEAGRRIIPASYQELLNVTLRWVEADPFPLLAYATGPRLCAVLLFSQEMTERAEADMRRMTSEMIEAVLALGGSYYLPYRPHATLDQFRRAYPGWERLVALKAELDPERRFRNRFWDRYLGAAA